MGSSGAIKDFKFDGDDGQSKTIEKCVPVEQFLVQYHDHESKQQTRLVVREPKSGKVFIINGQVQGQPILIPATKWFQGQMKEFLETNEEVSSV